MRKYFVTACLLTCLGTSALAAPAIAPWGADLVGRDLTVAPGDDFYRYANGRWLDSTTIPPGAFMASPSAEVRMQTRENIHRLLEAKAADSADQDRVSVLYRAFMDTAAIEARGARPLQPMLKEIERAKGREALAAIAGRSYFGFESSPVWLYIGPDTRDATRYSPMLRLQTMGLPGRQYYLDEKLAPQKQAYQRYVASMLGLLGWSDPQRYAAQIVALETRFAEADWTPSQYRDRDKTYNPTAPKDLPALAPGFAWSPFLREAGLADVTSINVSAPAPTAAFATIWSETPLPVLKAWLAYRTVDEAADFLPSRFADTRNDFRLGVLRGQTARDPRWLNGVGVLNSLLSADMSRLYVQTYLKPEAKAAVEQMAEHIRQAFAARIERADWMAPSTKQAALEKLSAMLIEIGTPPHLNPYDGLVMKGGDLFGNAQTALSYKWRSKLDDLGKPVDRHRWTVPPQFSGAFYDGSLNLSAVPAGSLQPPGFDLEADPAVNYGALGAVIGHELSHGFDDQGRKLDGAGNLRDWWTAEDTERFNAEAKKLAEQYSQHEPLPGIHVNGPFVVGEALADLGGLLVALDAYHLSLQGRPAPVLDGLTGDQRLFLSFAQAWRAKEAEGFLRSTLLTNPHSPPDVRVEETVRNIDAWFEAFDVKPGDRQYRAPEDRVRIW